VIASRTSPSDRKGDLAGIARARALSRATMRNVRQNLVLAFVYNVLGIPLEACHASGETVRSSPSTPLRSG
jgi:cation transport ATPase